MDKLLKDKIVEAVNSFMSEHDLKPAEFARKADVNESYFNYVYRGKYTYQNTEVKDAFFRKIAAAASFDVEPTYWSHINTNQYDEIIYKLIEAHKYKYLNTIIGSTGAGKSYAVERYRKLHPLDTIVITVNNGDGVKSLLFELAAAIDLELPHHPGYHLRAIARKLKQIYEQGRVLLIIIDEAENTKTPCIKAYKAIYDLAVKLGYCGMAIVGTDEFLVNLDRYASRRGQQGVVQFKRRILAGITHLPAINTKEEFAKFLDAASIEDNSLRQLLQRQCGNYGVLHDYLERAIRIADEESEPLTEEFFRRIYNIPSTKLL